jgi:dTDP-4-dehydrorhamnose reductase
MKNICLRYFNVYGLNQRYDAYGNVIPIFANRILKGEAMTINGDGEQTRDFVNVTDVAGANIAAALSPDVCGVFNIGSGTRVTINELVRLIQEAAGIEVGAKNAPPRPGDVRDSLADISAAQKAFGFNPQINLKDGLIEYMKWIRQDPITIANIKKEQTMLSSTSNIERRTSNLSLLVLGGEGMLGHKMFQTLSSRYSGTKCTIFGSLADPFYRSISLFKPEMTVELVNAMDLTGLKGMVEKEKPDFIINCIGIVKQRDEGRMAIPSITINSLMPHLLAEWSNGWGGRLIHFSTDCVFSGKKGRYNEDDPSDAEDLYGKSKFLGEVSETDNALTLRTSIIGRELTNFKSLLEWFLAQKGKKLKGFRRVIYSGVTTNYISELVTKIITEHPDLSGLYQVTAPPISKYDLLCRLRIAYGLELDIVADETEVSDRSMVGSRFLEITGYREPTWDYLIKQLTEDSTPYRKWIKEPKNV